MALDADSEVDAHVEGFLVGKPQLSGKLVDADFLGQLVIRSSPIEGQRSVRVPEPGAALHSHTTPVFRTPVLTYYGQGPVAESPQGPPRTTLRPVGSPFEPQDGVVLVAVERANGGELAPLEQVLWTLDSLTPPGSKLDPASFAESATALVEFGVIEYVEGQLGLTVEGRKLLRRSGLLNDPRHVAHVNNLLGQFDEFDVEQHKRAEPPPAPTEDDVRRALSDAEEIEETPGGVGTPVIGEEVPVGALWGGFGSRWVPAVSSEGEDDAEPPPLPIDFDRAPAHRLLGRLFGRGRSERA